jgi:hypothetical protein
LSIRSKAASTPSSTASSSPKSNSGKMRDRQIAWVPTFAPVQTSDRPRRETSAGATKSSATSNALSTRTRKCSAAPASSASPMVAGSDAGSCGVPCAWACSRNAPNGRAGCPRWPSSNPPPAPAPPRSPSRKDRPHRAGLPVAIHPPRANDPLETVANLQKDKTIFFDGQRVTCDADMRADGL